MIYNDEIIAVFNDVEKTLEKIHQPHCPYCGTPSDGPCRNCAEAREIERKVK